LSAFPESCEVFADAAVINSGIVHFSSVKLAGFIGHCTLSFFVHFAGAQKATTPTRQSIIMRTIVSAFVQQLLPVSSRVTVSVPFSITG
jgi:hypothetical protein